MNSWVSARALAITGMLLVSVELWAGRFASGISGLVWLLSLAVIGMLYRRATTQDSAATAPELPEDPSPHLAESATRGVEAVLSDRLVYERTTAAILEDFVHYELEDFEDHMSRVLSRLGSFTGASRCFLYRHVGHSQEYVRLMVWHSPVVEATFEPPLVLPAADAAQLTHALIEEPVILVNRAGLSGHALTDLAPWAPTMESDHSCGAVRIVQADETLGFIGFEARATSAWGEAETSLLQLTANLFSAMFSRLDAQQRQIEAMETLKAGSKAKSEFLANMSHEIRTPLNGVIGITDLLKETKLTPAQAEYVDIVATSGSLLMSLVNDVLDMSKIEAGQLILDAVETDLRVLVEDLMGLVAFNAQKRGLEMVYRLAPDLPQNVLIDSGRVRQVLTNLLNNATKFTHAGHISLNVDVESQQNDDVVLRFQVTDTGIGISQGQADRIFDKFTQADATTTRRFGGTGLGLSICRHLVNLMDGRIWATGILGKGSTFTFTIPAKTTKAVQPVVPQGPAHRVLVVTGHEIGGTVLAEQIRTLGHHCRVAAHIEEVCGTLARSASHAEKPWSYLLLDPAALGASADQALSRIEKTPVRPRPRIVLLSPLAATACDHEPLGDRVHDVLSKPVRSAQLAALLQDGPCPQAAVSAEATLPSAVPVPEPGGDGPRVLLAEDNLFNQKVASGMLRLLGCRVALAVNGSQALAMVQGGDFDLVFMDCQMPEMDGYEATRRIRALPGEVAGIPIIAITANAFRGDREACQAAGMNDYLTKPVSKDQFDRMLATWGSQVVVGTS